MSAEEAGTVEVVRDGAVATVTLVRPAKHNAVTPQLDGAMAAAFAELARDDAVRVVVITGAGDEAFCTGADISTLLPVLRTRVATSDDPIDFCGLSHRHPLPGKPIVAAVNGLALGGGFELALASDLRIASTAARFGLPEPRWGLIPAAGGCARVLHALAPAVAAEVLLAGRRLDAEEALRWGLVSRVVEPPALRGTAAAIAQRMAETPLPAMRGLVDFWRAQRARQDEAALREERALFEALVASPETEAGIARFLARRPQGGAAR
jgi:enoyl-CoA hydratase/carnithine racemase